MAGLKSALILGGHGFIGHHMARRLKQEGYWVRTVDIKDYYYGDLKSEVDDYVIADLRDFNSCWTCFHGPYGGSFDEVYALAANMGGAGYIFVGNNDTEIIHDSALINLNVAESAKIERPGKLFFSSSACFIAGTLVYTDRGFTPIEKIDNTFQVISEDGKWHKVEKRTEKEYEGTLCEIACLGANKVTCTPDHRFLTSDGWIKAIDLAKKAIVEPVPDLSGSEEIITLERDPYIEMYKELLTYDKPLYLLAEKYSMALNVPYKWARDKKYPTKVDPVVKDSIIKDYDLGKFLGLVLSEGWYEKHNKYDTHRVVVCFGKHEIELIDEYKALLNKIFGIYPEKIIQYTTRTAIKIHVTSKRLVYILDKLCKFKEGCYSKELTQFGMTGSDNYRRGILEGANAGDGSSQLVSHGQYFRYLWASTSNILALQYSLLLKSLGIKNSIGVRKESTWSIEGRSGISHEAYQIYTKINPTEVQDVKTFTTESVKVYNLEIADVHSYIVEGLIAHNCIYPSHNQTDPNNPKTSEDSAYPANPDSPYGLEKLFSEKVYQCLAKNYGLNIKIARFHNIYGKESAWSNGREKAPAAMSRKVAMTEDGGEIEIWGNGEQTRSFLYIDECLNGVCRLMASDFVGPVNIGSDEMVSINQLVEIVKGIANKPNITIKHVDGPIGVMGRTSDNALIQQMLGWAPDYPLVEGLKPTYAWIEEQVNLGKEDCPWGG